MLEARSVYNQAISALNQVLAVPVHTRWTLEEPGLQDGHLGFLDDVLDIDDLVGLAHFKKFAFHYAHTNDPLLLAIERSIDAARYFSSPAASWMVGS